MLLVLSCVSCDFLTDSANPPNPDNSEPNAAQNSNPGSRADVFASYPEIEPLYIAQAESALSARAEIIETLALVSDDGAKTLTEEQLTDADVDEFISRINTLRHESYKVAWATYQVIEAIEALEQQGQQRDDGMMTVQQPIGPAAAIFFLATTAVTGVGLFSGMAEGTGELDSYATEQIKTASPRELAVINETMGLRPETPAQESQDHFQSQYTFTERTTMAKTLKIAVNDAANATGDPSIRFWDFTKPIQRASVKLGKTAVKTVASSVRNALPGQQLPDRTAFSGGWKTLRQIFEETEDARQIFDWALSLYGTATGARVSFEDFASEYFWTSTTLKDSTGSATIPGHFEEGIYDALPEDIPYDRLEEFLERAAQEPDYYRSEHMDHVLARLAEFLSERVDGVNVDVTPTGTTVEYPMSHLRKAPLEENPIELQEFEGDHEMTILIPGEGFVSLSGPLDHGETVDLMIDDGPATNNSTPDNSGTTNSNPNADPGADSDGDTIPDSEDNCPDTPNFYQVDTDMDGIGNDCDETACPDFELDEDGCVDGMDWSRNVAACVQPSCPTGSRHTADMYCCCNCWDDKTLVNVIDPCRAGYLLNCSEPDPNE